MISLDTWNLSIPVGVPSTVIENGTLNSGYKSEYFNNEGSKITFWAPVTGTHTKDSKYPRSELRETKTDGSLNNWKYQDGDSYLSAALSVSQVPSSGKIVIGQIHSFKDDNPMIKLQFYSNTQGQRNKTGNIEALVRLDPDTDAVNIPIAQDIKLNQRFTYGIYLSSKGVLKVIANGQRWESKISPKWNDYTQYFKAGAYVQDNSGYATEGGRVTFYKLAISH
jgi:hypothetical protein